MTPTLTTNWLRRLLNAEPRIELEEELREQHASAIAWLYSEMIELREGERSQEELWEALLWASLSFNHLEAQLTDPEEARASIMAALAEVDRHSPGPGGGDGSESRKANDLPQVLRDSCSALFMSIARIAKVMRPQRATMHRLQDDERMHCVARPIMPSGTDASLCASLIESAEDHGAPTTLRPVAEMRHRPEENKIAR